VPQITPFLSFNDNAEEAVNFYVSLFKDAKVTSTARYSEAGPGPAGSVMTMKFQIGGVEFIALNGGPHDPTLTVSFVVNCETQAEVDRFWDQLGKGGKTHQCGWVTDRFGITWQVTPTILPKFLQDKDTTKAARVMQAMMNMVKLDIPALERAYNGD